MNNSLFFFESAPQNEPIDDYVVGSASRASLKAELTRQAATEIEIPLVIGGKEIRTGKTRKVVMPCEHKQVLATYHLAGEREVQAAIDAACTARKAWLELSWVNRASITLKAAELLSKKYRDLVNAATMLGQGKNAYQAEIDSACEAIDFLRYNAYFASKVYSDQPRSRADQLNRTEYRPLEGFIFALSPFNFSAIASNLNMTPVLMGNATVWKPSSTAVLSNYYLFKLFQEAGVPDGVINFCPGDGATMASVLLGHPELAGVHFTGGTDTFNSIWRTVGQNLGKYRSYPRLVGETGGKDFVVAHPSADPQEVAVGLVRGAFEYQGQKCSAASRAYLPKSLWPKIREAIRAMLSEVRVGDVRDFRNYVNAVIDEKSFDNIMGYIEKAKATAGVEVVAGGTGDKSKGFYVQPTVLQTDDPNFLTMREEIFGPVLTIYVYEDSKFEETLKLCDATSPYALTGAIFSRDRYAVERAYNELRYAAGNFYINDKPTGAMVGMQPFGGARQSGTNDKAGGVLNLLRWVSPRSIKETYVSPVRHGYPFMAAE